MADWRPAIQELLLVRRSGSQRVLLLSPRKTLVLPPVMITLDLPLPVSVNTTRKVDWAAMKERKQWLDQADALVLINKQNRQNAIIGQFEAHITLSPNRKDLDNCLKLILDYCVRSKLVTDDGPDYLRKITAEFGPTPEGCRVILKPFQPYCPFVTGTRRRAIVEYLWNHPDGISANRLAEVIYAGYESGSTQSIWVICHHANKQLKPQGWRIRSSGGPGSIYKLVRIEKAAPAGEAA